MNDTKPFINNIWTAIHTYGKTYNATKDNKCEYLSCFLKCLSKLLPDEVMREIMNNFIKQNPPNRCNNELFEWTFKLHSYYNLVLKKRGQYPEDISFKKLSEEYSFITKTDWGRPTWFLMHYIAANLPEKLTEDDATTFKAFVVCLSFILPCDECKKHMNMYISNAEIDPYLKRGKDVFKWTWIFHNNVNKRLNKPQLELEKAYNLYRTVDIFTLIEDY